VLAVLTSEGDIATRVFFRIGRWFSTFFEKEGVNGRWNATTEQTECIDEGTANATAVGHFEPYRTHFLQAVDPHHEDTLAKQSIAEPKKFFHVAQSWRRIFQTAELYLVAPC